MARVTLFGDDSAATAASGVLTSSVWADGLIDVPAGQTIKQGDPVRFLPLAELLG